MDYYTAQEKDFAQLRPDYTWRIVATHEDQQQLFAADLADRIQQNQQKGKLTKIAVPTGPIDFKVFADYCNAGHISCDSLVVFLVDEFCNADGTPVPSDSPFCLKSYIEQQLYHALDTALRMPPEQIFVPDPANPGTINEAIDQYNGLDVTYSGLGINGHIAMNEPPEHSEQVTIEEMQNWTTRLVTMSRESVTQLAMAMTAGNIEQVPPKMVTMGIRELLAAAELHLYFLRTWHAGGFRRALFGPVTSDFPGSLYQTHPSVTVTLTHTVTDLPLVNVMENIGA